MTSPHVIFWGGTGTGKTARAREYADRFVSQTWIDAAFTSGVGAFREQIRQLARRRSGGLALIVVENADLLTVPCQQALRRLMEKQSHLCRFCFCVWGSTPSGLIPALQSRALCLGPSDAIPAERVKKKKSN